MLLKKRKKEICQLPGIVLTWLTFSSISDMATVFFLSGLSFQYIDMAALLTACSNLLSEDRLLISCAFSGVMPASREVQKNAFRIIINNLSSTITTIFHIILTSTCTGRHVLNVPFFSTSPHLYFGSSISEVVWLHPPDLVLLPSQTIQQLYGYLSLCLFLLPV